MQEDLKLQTDLYRLLIEELISRINSGEATAPELNCARQLLKDMNFQPQDPGNEEHISRLNQEMQEAMGLNPEDLKDLTCH